MAGFNLGDPEAMAGLPYPVSPITAGGEDPDEVREQMAAQAARMGNTQLPGGITLRANTLQPVQPAAMTRPAPPAATSSLANFNSDVARQSMTGQLSAARNLAEAGNQMQPDPEIAALQQKKMADEAAAPNAQDYKPGFGTRLLRGLKGAGLGFAQGGFFGAAAGAIDPALVRGGTAYGAPTDAYDVALSKNKQQVGQDTEALTNAQANFKTAQDLRAAREKATQESGEAFKGAGTTATTQEGEETKAAEVPIHQKQADTEAQKVFNEGPDGKLRISQAEIDRRTQLADAQHMPPGFTRTRYILTGEMQPGREATAEEIAVNRILSSWRTEHGGQGPKTVEDWQSIYSAAKGGGRGGSTDDSKDLRELASLAEKRAKDLRAQMNSKGAVLWSDEERKQHQADLDAAEQEAAGYRQRLAGAGQDQTGGNPQPGGAGAPQMPAGAKDGSFSADGRFVVQNGTMVKATDKNGRVRMRVPNPAGGFRYATFPPEQVQRAAQLGGQFAGLQGQ